MLVEECMERRNGGCGMRIVQPREATGLSNGKLSFTCVIFFTEFTLLDIILHNYLFLLISYLLFSPW